MEHQKIINLVNKASNRPSKFRTKNWVKRNYDSPGTYNTNSQIRFETTRFKSSLWDYRHAYIFVTGTVAAPNNRDKEVNIWKIKQRSRCFS